MDDLTSSFGTHDIVARAFRSMPGALRCPLCFDLHEPVLVAGVTLLSCPRMPKDEVRAYPHQSTIYELGVE